MPGPTVAPGEPTVSPVGVVLRSLIDEREARLPSAVRHRGFGATVVRRTCALMDPSLVRSETLKHLKLVESFSRLAEGASSVPSSPPASLSLEPGKVEAPSGSTHYRDAAPLPFELS